MRKHDFILGLVTFCFILLSAMSVMAQNGDKKSQWKDNDKAFVDLVRNGNFESIKKAVSEGANVNARWSNGVSVLRWAVMKCDYEAVKLLLDNGASVPEDDDLLIYCAECGVPHKPGAWVTEKPWELAEPREIQDSIKIAKLLLAHGVDINHRSNKSMIPTALERTAHWGLLEMAQFLLDNGAKVTIGEMNWAAYRGRKEMVEMLLQKITDINEKDSAGRSALTHAAEKGSREVTALLLQRGSKAELIDLVMAAKSEDIGALELLIPKISDIDAEENHYSFGRPCTALMSAAGAGRIKNMELLLSKGANIDKQNSLGETALMIAEYKSEKEAVDFLLKKGAKAESGQHSFDPGGYYILQMEIIHSGYKIDSFCLYDYLDKNKCHLELIRTSDQEDYWYSTSAPTVRPDLISLVFDSTPIGTIKIEGNFIEKQGHFWESDEINGQDVPVAEATVTISNSKETKKYEHVYLTYYAGD